MLFFYTSLFIFCYSNLTVITIDRRVKNAVLRCLNSSTLLRFAWQISRPPLPTPVQTPFFMIFLTSSYHV